MISSTPSAGRAKANLRSPWKKLIARSLVSFGCIQEKEDSVCFLCSLSLSRHFSRDLLGSAYLPTASLTLQMPLSSLPRLSDCCHLSQMMQCSGSLPSQTHREAINPCQGSSCYVGHICRALCRILAPSWFSSNLVFLLP